MDDVAARLRELGGQATTAQLAAPRPELELAVATGLVLRLARGRYTLPETGAARRAAWQLGGVLTGLSAAQQQEWSLRVPPKRIEVTVPRERKLRNQPSGVVVRRRDLPTGHVVDGLLTPAATVVDCARRLGLPDALSVADSARRAGVTTEELDRAWDALPRHGRARARHVLDLADPRAANPFESATRAAACCVPGLRLVPQVQVEEIGRSDLVDEALRLVVECDSWEFHGDEQAFRRDARRYSRMVARGWLVVRVVWLDAVHHPALVRAELTRLVGVRASDPRFARVVAGRGGRAQCSWRGVCRCEP